ncbi:hypothetical protein [Actinoalloteichus sp. GBA129-24]|uniref:hypothetical protein n=1 Tax=Actinoalloteichus sp. GBA129-24 TaxID=1612551 RepID=UPI0012FB18A0|nr:hypothetical protein [Actinoalloteichus sp. GBA129-24]
MTEPAYPTRCDRGHPLVPGWLLVGWHPCDCTPGLLGHRTVTCVRCLDAGAGRDTWHHPPCSGSVLGRRSY